MLAIGKRKAARRSLPAGLVLNRLMFVAIALSSIFYSRKAIATSSQQFCQRSFALIADHGIEANGNEYTNLGIRNDRPCKALMATFVVDGAPTSENGICSE